MRLTVKDEAGAMVAAVEVDPACEFHRHGGSVVAHVVGRFAPGEGYARIRSMLDAFHEAYASGQHETAIALHEKIDRLGLSAVDESGTVYRVFNVYFQQGALLFAAATPA